MTPGCETGAVKGAHFEGGLGMGEEVVGDPLVSVIIPTYNHAHYVGQAIESLLAQTYENWELAVVDDGSTDDTAEVIATYQDPRITYLPESHRGVGAIAATLNVGLRHTTGALVTMLGSDDLWPAYRIEGQVPFFRDPSVVLCFGRGFLIGESGNDLGEYPLPRFVSEVMNRPVGSILGSLLVSNWLPQYTVLIRRAALERIGGYLQPPDLLAEDYPTHLALALLGEFRYVDLPMGYYRMHPHQQTRIHRFEMARADARMVMDFYRRLTPETQKLTGLTEAGLAREMAKSVSNAYFQQGRRMLLRGDRLGALGQFMIALWRGGPHTKAKALAGMSCAVLGLDLERVGALLGRPRIA